MKILFVGDLNSYARTWARARAFRELGHELELVGHTAIGGEDQGYVRTSYTDRILRKFGHQADWEHAGRRLLKFVREQCVDIAWIEKGTMISAETLKIAKMLRPSMKIAFFSEDDMMAPHNTTRRFRAGLQYYDIVFTTKSFNAEEAELPRSGARNVVFVYQAFDEWQHHEVALTRDEEIRFGADVSFIGGYERERAASIYELARRGVAVRVWGLGWERCHLSHPLMLIERRPLLNNNAGLNYTKGIAAAKISLCFLRKINRDLHTSRTFEIPAVGGFLLAERTSEHCMLYKEGIEAEFFGSNAELFEKVSVYIQSPERRSAIASAGHARCVAQYSSTRQGMRLLDLTMQSP